MAVIPRDASTVVLTDENYNVFITKRPETMKFLGGFYVFPGGAVDKNDPLVNEKRLIGEIESQHLVMGHYVAAARELFEEIGILLCNQADGSPVIFDEPTSQLYREQLINRQITFGNILEKEQLYFNLNHLQYIGQIITPKRHPIRFDTRFFLARLPKGQSPKPNEHEIAESFWMEPEEVLHKYRTKQLLVAPPTAIVLEAIIAYKNGNQLQLPQEKVNLLDKLG